MKNTLIMNYKINLTQDKIDSLKQDLFTYHSTENRFDKGIDLNAYLMFYKLIFGNQFYISDYLIDTKSLYSPVIINTILVDHLTGNKYVLVALEDLNNSSNNDPIIKLHKLVKQFNDINKIPKRKFKFLTEKVIENFNTANYHLVSSFDKEFAIKSSISFVKKIVSNHNKSNEGLNNGIKEFKSELNHFFNLKKQ